jgi:hypothetical protein
MSIGSYPNKYSFLPASQMKERNQYCDLAS